jgi:hypothetical protein
MNLRNTGLFPMPSTAGLFAILSLFYLINPNKRNYFIILIATISVYLTASALSFFLMIIVLFHIFKVKRRYFVFSGSISIPILIAAAPFLLGRADLWKSLSDRVLVWTKFVKDFEIFNFYSTGIYTNAYTTYIRNVGMVNWEKYVVDGDYLQILMNFGSIFLLVYIVSIVIKWSNSSRSMSYFWLVFVLTSVTINLLEVSFAILIISSIIYFHESKKFSNRDATTS